MVEMNTAEPNARCENCHAPIDSGTLCAECEKESTHCTCNENSETEHGCPYQEDVNDDSDYRCMCCAYCQQNCADDI